MAVSEAALRRTQAERTASMRARLLDATVDCLVELGYTGTTTTEVVRRAGVSRGAQVHHFPTKQDLVVAAIEHVLDARFEEFFERFLELDDYRRSLGAALDMLWEHYRGPTFAAWLELAVAARTDPELRPHFLALEARFEDRSAAMFDQLFPRQGDPTFTRLAVRFAFAMLDGLALQRHLGIDGGDAEDLLEMLKMLSTMYASELGGTP